MQFQSSLCSAAHYAVWFTGGQEKRNEKRKDGWHDGMEGMMERKAWCGTKRRCLSAGDSLQMVFGCEWRLKSLRQAVNKGV
jgi:hypothetical protein